MKSNEIQSWRTALRYLIQGDDRRKRIRLAVILLVMALVSITAIAALIALGISVGAS